MLTTQQALAICIDRIVNGTKHANFDRTVNLAKLYKQLITGEEHDELIAKFFASCSEEDKKKIKETTFPITSAVCNSLITVFEKVHRTQPVMKQIDFTGKEVEKKKTEVESALKEFYAGQDLDYYILTRFCDLSFRDPNSFIVTEFSPFDHKTEKAKPYPFEVYSDMAVNFGLTNGVLNFLLVEQNIQYLEKDGKTFADGVKLTIYLEKDSIVFTQVGKTVDLKGDEKTRSIQGTDKKLSIFVSGEKQFAVAYYQHNQGAVPAVRVGYVQDKMTNGETFVSPIHYGALPYLMKTISSCCEMDMSMRLHAFPQKYAYEQKCKTDVNAVCTLSGEKISTCKKCGGTGMPFHQSSKDIVTVPLPKDIEEMFDLEKLSHYSYPPIDGIKFQDEYIEKLKITCHKSVFNAETFITDGTVKTATEAGLNFQNAYDTLSKYAWKVSDFWMRTTRFVSVILDHKDSNHKLVYGKDFKMKSVTDLLNDLKLAGDSSAPSFVKMEFTRDIASIIFQDRPNELRRFEAKMNLYPFSGKSMNEIIVLVNSDKILPVDKVLYNYFDPICNELESMSLIDNDGIDTLLTDAKLKTRYAEAKKKGLIWLYDLPEDIQKFLVYAKAKLKLTEIEDAMPAAIDFNEPVA